MRIVFALALCGLLAACGTPFVPPPPETPREAVVAAETSLTAVLRDMDAARQDGLIDEGEKAELDALVRAVDTALDAAQAAVTGGDAEATNQWLEAARDGIEDLRTELREAEDE